MKYRGTLLTSRILGNERRHVRINRYKKSALSLVKALERRSTGIIPTKQGRMGKNICGIKVSFAGALKLGLKTACLQGSSE